MPTTPPPSPLPSFRTLQLWGWGAFLIAMSFSRVGRYPLPYMIAEKTLLTILGVGISLILHRLLRHLLRVERSVGTLIAACVAASYLLALVWTATFNVLAQPIASAFGINASVRTLGQLFGGTVYHAFALLAWGVLYIGIRHYAALLDERERAGRAEAAASEARLRALQYQLNPHLLFNTLNAISTLIVERRNDDASQMVARLGDFLRTTLRRDGRPLVTLADELTFVGEYLDIEQLRFGDRLRVTYDVDEDTYAALVPALLLQPLVENAVRHGIAPNEGKGTMALTTRRHGSTLVIGVENSTARHPGPRDAGGIGLANVRERLAVLYGDRAQLRAGAVDGGAFGVTLVLPYTVDPAAAGAGDRRHPAPAAAVVP